MLKVKNQTDTAEIYINGTIVDDEDSNWIKFFDDDSTGYEFPKEIREQLATVKGKPLNIYINSYGGSVAAGIAMANMIKRHDAPTTAYVDAYCCSIATQIFFSADVCKMPSNSYLMLHKPSTIEAGNADDFRKTAEVLDTIQRGLESIYLEKAREQISTEELSAMVNDETWLTGEEAAKIFNIELLKPMKIVNCIGSLERLKSLHYQKIPSQLKFSNNSRIEKDNWLITDEQEIEIAIARWRGMNI